MANLDTLSAGVLITTLTTAANMMIMPVNTQSSFDYPSLKQNSLFEDKFTPNYVVVDNRIVEVSHVLTREIRNTNSLINIGSLIFKDSRGISMEESLAMNSYFKSKYKKIKK